MKLTREVLYKSLSEHFEITNALAERFTDTLVRTMMTIISVEKTLKIKGFGSFSILNKKPRMGRNPKTQEAALICARQTVRFRVSKLLKEKMNKKRRLKIVHNERAKSLALAQKKTASEKTSHRS